MKTWLTALAIVAVGVGATPAVVAPLAAQPAHGTRADGGGGHSDYRTVDRWLKEFDQVASSRTASGSPATRNGRCTG
jgi:hypothetical protein